MNRILLKTVPAILAVLCLFLPFAGRAQDDDSKAIKAEVFVNTRPPRKSHSTAKYKRVKAPTESAEAAPPPGTAFAQLGVTLWRFRPTKATDKTKELVEEESGPVEWTLERIAEGTPLAPGQRVRLSIESLSRDGFLYVVDREEYADGSLGDPILIFPTQKTAGANKVQAGRLTYIPSATGRFWIKPSNSAKEHVAEVLTIIVSPTPLVSDDQLGPRSIKLQRELVESWQKNWSTTPAKFEMEGGSGQTMTGTEQVAATQSAALLTQEDPVPQTVYRVAIKPETPVMITVPLKFARTN